MDFSYYCAFCGVGGHLLRCAGCKRAYYCSKEHQKQDWRKHKKPCRANFSHNSSGSTDLPVNNVSRVPKPHNMVSESERNSNHPSRPELHLGVEYADRNISPITYEGSSESEIISAGTEELDHILEFLQSEMNNPSSSTNVATPVLNNQMNFNSHSVQYPDILNVYGRGIPGSCDISDRRLTAIDTICRNVIKDMDAYGVCAVDNFLGHENGMAVLNEVTGMHRTGVFKDGQLVRNRVKNDIKTIRGDQITWIDGKELFCQNIGMLIRKVDEVIMRANRMTNNGKMGDYVIEGRTKAMVACYPGHGSHYVKHVDNPNKDGRCITAIYYLNAEWDVQVNGGLLRIFPDGTDQVADIEPLFDRILFFWSDRRNPHEVQPAFKTRYAITLWYFDKNEREEACRRYQRESMCCVLPPTHKNPPLVTNCS